MVVVVLARDEVKYSQVVTHFDAGRAGTMVEVVGVRPMAE